MTEAIYDWMKNLAFFYIFLTAVMNLVPDKSYGEQIRFFLGLLLILLILSPLLELFGLAGRAEEIFSDRVQMQDWLDIQMEEFLGEVPFPEENPGEAGGGK